MNNAYAFSLIDDFGIWQHATGNHPLPKEGYALDDATRGLILCLLTDHLDHAGVLLRYLAASYHDERWYGFATAKRDFINAPASDDAVGQVVWATGLAIERGFEPELARRIYKQAQQTLASQADIALRGYAYALLGAQYIDPDWSAQLAQKLMKLLLKTTSEWPWPEAELTYANMIIPYALLRYGRSSGDPAIIKQGGDTLKFVQAVYSAYEPMGPVGNHGWYTRGDRKPARFDQQPIDGAYAIWAHVAHFEITGDAASLTAARAWLNWFHGANVAGQALADSRTAQCFDGINGPDHIHISSNSGAESNVCYALGVWALEHQRTF